MWTICWTDSSGDHWDRGTADEVMKIIHSNHIEANDEDVLIFSPDADDCSVPISKFIRNYESKEGECS